VNASGFVVRLGALAIAQARRLAEQQALLKRTLHFCVRSPNPRRGVATQMYTIGNQSLVFLIVVMGFIGMITVFQAGIQLKRVIPDMSQLGATYLELLIKDLAPTLCSLMLATRVGAGIAAEVGAMVVTEQVDALRMCAADPVDYLVRPRFIASVLMTAVLVIIGTGVASATGTVTALLYFGVPSSTFLDFRQVDAGDLMQGLAKCFAYGATIPLISSYWGLATRGGSEGVGTSTTRAVVGSSLGVILLDFLISGIGYEIFG
jgi:phospholipid/cholesterol/gamma-HCH transport system permease protein